ncbi:hypothetical protein, partial [Candidatus Frankia alpina]|uniref:hypothetical protein n=1 Tax=Candidatus Frankia alpina TaxID=2699483 RepID=UPI00138747F9
MAEEHAEQGIAARSPQPGAVAAGGERRMQESLNGVQTAARPRPADPTRLVGLVGLVGLVAS